MSTAIHPKIKILALSSLLFIEFSLIHESFGLHVRKGQSYFAMGFLVFVELINLRVRARKEPVRLNRTYVDTGLTMSA